MIGCSTDPGHRTTAVYIPDPDLLFHRISFPQNFSERNVPRGGSAVMAEITANAGDGVWELSDEAILARTIDELETIGFLDRNSVVYQRVER